MPNKIMPPLVVINAMADGIGDLAYASPAWVEAAADALKTEVARRKAGLGDLETFTICEVGHNPPAYLHLDSPLAWYARFEGGTVEVLTGELPAEECTIKVQGDHSVISNLARLQHQGKDPVIVAAAQARLVKLSRWQTKGEMPKHKVLAAVMRTLHDTMAVRTLPRFVFMTPEWVSIARHILSTRAASAKYADKIKDIVYTFSEEFTDTPRYAFPDGSPGGFWVHCNHGQITVGSGPLPAEFAPADALNRRQYIPVVPMGRTVERDVTEAERIEKEDYIKTAFRLDKEANQGPIKKSFPSGKGEMPADLARVFLPLHDEMSKRTSGELPADFDPDIKKEWATPQRFDRCAGYDKSWLRFNKVDIYGEPLD
jgi:hypothetical protein